VKHYFDFGQKLLGGFAPTELLDSDRRLLHQGKKYLLVSLVAF
jgi:hypothetical protein